MRTNLRRLGSNPDAYKKSIYDIRGVPRKITDKIIDIYQLEDDIFKITPPNKEFGDGRLTRIKKNISPFKKEVFKIINEKKSNINELKITIGAMDHILKKVINTDSDSYKFIKIIRELNIFLNESIINYNPNKLKEIIEVTKKSKY